jgi:isoleucyl-tRNA synthetase
MQANMLARQEAILRQWQAQDIYRSILEEHRDSRTFIIHDGPPYASGQVHVGIGMNKIIKDVIAKFHSMNDRRVPFIPGWDCHGLPIELEVLKKTASDTKRLSVLEIRKFCEMSAQGYIKEQKRQFQLLGVFADWDRPYLTMSPAYEAGVITTLLDMVEKGYVYHDRRPTAWCCECRTALAEAEIEYLSAPVPSLWFHLKAGSDLARLCNITSNSQFSMLGWTTSIWSLPGSVAVAVNPNYAYGAYRYTDARGVERISLICEDLAESALTAIEVKRYEKLAQVQGTALEGLEVLHPVFDRNIPIILADFITKDSGSGLVNIAPGHELNDFIVGQKYDLEIISPLDEKGTFTAEAGAFCGLDLQEGQKAILDSLAGRGALASIGDETHVYPHCWRCAGSLIARATKQWFVKLDHREHPEGGTLRERMLLELQLVQWIPSVAYERIRSMVENRPDWCISRQRAWGVPLPSFVCCTCGESVLDPTSIRKIRDLVSTHGSNVWFKTDARDLLPAEFVCETCGGKEFSKDEHILDVWFESGTSWQSVLISDHRLSFPADLYVEGSDQHRGWFQLSILPSLVSRGKSPFRAALTHGFVLDEEFIRLNRARGGYVTLEESLQKYPADVIRLFFSSVNSSSDILLTPDSFRSVEPLYRTIRNTFRYLLGNLQDFAPQEDSIHLEDLNQLDLWALCRLHKLISEVSENYAKYKFHLVVHHLHSFCNDYLSKIYLNVVKDRLYCESPSSNPRRSTQTVLHSILMGLVKLFAPILPYTCEEVWALTPGRADCSSVHLSRWPRTDERFLRKQRSLEADEMFTDWLRLRRAVNQAIERMRKQKQISSSLDALVKIHIKNGSEQFLRTGTAAGLRDFLLVAEVAVESSGVNLTPVEDLTGVHFDVSVHPYPNCERCRRRDKTCGTDQTYKELCARCAEVLRLQNQVTPASTEAAISISPLMRPADLARFFRVKDIRKVALLNEDGKCRAYALHAASQEVRQQDELKVLADYVNQSTDLRGHAAILLGLGEHTDVLFGIGIHHLNYGSPLGGTREFAYTRVQDMLDNLLRLSWGMSLKNAAAELPHGGGKSIIDPCGWDLKVHREFRREVYRDFGQFTSTLFGRYICAEDVGNTTADTREMLYACRHVMCLSQGVSGSGNPSRFTALASWAAAKAGWKFLTGTTSLRGRTLALQGAGNVGSNLVAILIESDPDVERILIADRDVEQIEIIRGMLLKKGLLNVLKVVSSKDPTDKSAETLSYVERKDEEGQPYILYSPCDILIPAAVGNVINTENVDLLNCRLILPVANNVYSDNDLIATAMMERGIVDVVENNINWGGALAAASEMFGYDEDNVTLACLEAYHKTMNILEESRRRGCTPWSHLKETATDRIFREEHPVVRQARTYKFIGDINKGFADWIKQKWLRNSVDVDPDKFPAYVVERAKSFIP